MLHEIRLQLNAQENAQTSLSSAPTIIVLDAFTRGGAGVNNHGSSRDDRIGREPRLQRRAQARRCASAYLLEGGRYTNFDARNAAGTFTFSSLEAFPAGAGDVHAASRPGEHVFTMYQLGLSTGQDDIRLSNKFSFGFGVRNEMQSHIDDN